MLLQSYDQNQMIFFLFIFLPKSFLILICFEKEIVLVFRRHVVVNICAGTQQKHLCNLMSSAETEHSCKMCCRRKDGTCSPFVQADGSFLFLRKGKPCTVGFCDEGVSSSSITPASICSVFVLSFLASSPLAPPFRTGEVHEAGAGRDREVVGFH